MFEDQCLLKSVNIWSALKQSIHKDAKAWTENFWVKPGKLMHIVWDYTSEPSSGIDGNHILQMADSVNPFRIVKDMYANLCLSILCPSCPRLWSDSQCAPG